MSASRCQAAARSLATLALAAALLASAPGDAGAAWEGLGDLGPAASEARNSRQTTAPVAIAPYGRSVFVWEIDRSVYVRGVKPSGALDWLRVATIDGHDPIVAIDGSGTATVVWHSWSDSRLRTRTITAGGRMSKVRAVSPPGLIPARPELKVTPEGYALFMWLAYRDANPAVEAIQARSRSNGALGPVQNIVTKEPGSGQGLFPHVAMRPNGDAVFAWFQFEPKRSIRSRRRTADGTLAPIRTVAPHAGDGGMFSLGTDLALDIDPSGVATFAYLSNDRVMTRTGPGPVKPVSPSGETAQLPKLAIDGDGDALFAWNAPSALRARGRPAGGTLGPVQTVGAPFGSSFALSRTGAAVFVWMRVIDPGDLDTPPTLQPKARTRSAAGVLGPTTTLSDPVTDDYARVAVAVNAKGRAAAMFDAGPVERGALGP
jgi:hypothetical protein